MSNQQDPPCRLACGLPKPFCLSHVVGQDEVASGIEELVHADAHTNPATTEASSAASSLQDPPRNPLNLLNKRHIHIYICDII